MPQRYALPKFYRNLVLTFFTVSVLVLVSVFYLIWARVIIKVFPNTETVSQEFVFEVRTGAVSNPLDSTNLINGKVRSVEVSGEGNYSASGAKTLESNLVGEVVVINNYSQPQTLVESTRLAFPNAPSKIVARLNRTVTVAPGSRITVPVYPDNTETFETVPAGSRLIIPGLWGPIQDRIFAESSGELSKGAKTIAVVAQEDLDKAEENLRQQLYEKALLQINDELAQEETLWPKIFSRDVKALTYDVAVGDEVSEFKTAMTIQAIIIVFDESQLISVAREKIKATLPPDKQLVGLNPKNFIYEVESYDLAVGTAKIKAVLEGSSVLGATTNWIDKSSLTGLTEEQVKEFFANYPVIKNVEVQFNPSWLKKTPRIKEKIIIEIAS